jgi:glyoxylase-like metal-dependent hydrolase (beta-lactamase superfamily II)
MSSKVRSWTIGDVTITRIMELGEVSFEPGILFAQTTAEDVKNISWLQPHFATQDGHIIIAFQAFVIETPALRIVVDTCNGNDKQRPNSPLHELALPFLEDMTAAGYPPDSIDKVLCTHLHVDHVGWNTRLENGRWVPTFPNARYLFCAQEWASLSGGTHEMNMGDFIGDSVQPIFAAGLSDLVSTNHRITDEVWLEPTPGHTVGHVSVRISSAGEHAVITGDMVHNPLQCARPGLSTIHCSDPQQAARTRLASFADWSANETLVLGTHFGGPTAGHLKPMDGGYRFDAE